MYKLLQLNIECGGKDRPGLYDHLGMLPEIVDYIKQENFDLIAFQELSGNGYTIHNNSYIDCFDYLTKNLPDHHAKLFKTLEFEDNPATYYGVGAFYNEKFTLNKTLPIFMHQIPKQKTGWIWDDGPFGALLLELTTKEGDYTFNFISAHFQVGPLSIVETQDQIDKAAKLAQVVAKLKDPVIIAADTNLDWNMKTIEQFETLCLRNLAKEAQLINTINPKRTRHYENIFIKDPISSKRGGVACDNILVTKDRVEVINLEVSTADLSDHFGLILEFDLI